MSSNFLKHFLEHEIRFDGFIELILMQRYDLYFSSVEDMIRTIEDVTTLKYWKRALYIPGKTAGMKM